MSDQQKLPGTDEQPKGALIYEALSDVMRAVGPIAKSQRNEKQKYNFRGIEQVINACHPIFSEHGVISPSTILREQHEVREVNGKSVMHAIISMRYTFFARDGSFVTTEVVGEGIDYNGDKASNKAMSAAQKYALLQLLQIPTAMVDSDFSEPREKPPRNDNAPKVQPRAKREPEVTQKKVLLLLKEWKVTADVPGNQDEAKEMWFLYVQNVAERQFHPGAVDQWTQADYDAVRADLNMPSEEELMQ